MNRLACILISSGNTNFLNNCSSFFPAYGAQVIRVESDGKKVLDAIKRYHPDVVILNAVMPFFDASSVMYISREFKFMPPKFIVIANTEDPEVEKENLEVGASEYLGEPVNETLVFSKALKLISQANWNPKSGSFRLAGMPHKLGVSAPGEASVELLVDGLILDFGIPLHVNGYGYLREAILLCFRNENIKFNVTKNVYPFVAQINNSTPSRIERSMRHAISIAWGKDGDTSRAMQRVLAKKPTNSQFIALILSKLRMSARPRQAG